MSSMTENEGRASELENREEEAAVKVKAADEIRQKMEACTKVMKDSYEPKPVSWPSEPAEPPPWYQKTWWAVVKAFGGKVKIQDPEEWPFDHPVKNAILPKKHSDLFPIWKERYKKIAQDEIPTIINSKARLDVVVDDIRSRQGALKEKSEKIREVEVELVKPNEEQNRLDTETKKMPLDEWLKEDPSDSHAFVKEKMDRLFNKNDKYLGTVEADLDQLDKEIAQVDAKGEELRKRVEALFGNEKLQDKNAERNA